MICINKASSADLDELRIYLYARCINGIGDLLSVSLTLRRPRMASDPNASVLAGGPYRNALYQHTPSFITRIGKRLMSTDV
jgi:hypothetical protein